MHGGKLTVGPTVLINTFKFFTEFITKSKEKVKTQLIMLKNVKIYFQYMTHTKDILTYT